MLRILAALIILFSALQALAGDKKDKLIFVYYTVNNKKLVNRSLKENLLTLKKLKHFQVVAVEGNSRGIVYSGKTYGADSFFKVLSSVMSDCGKRDCWLIFAGDRVGTQERGFFYAGGRVFTFTELSDFLSKEPKLFFLGFDQCSNGSPFILRHFLFSAKYVAGSPYLEPNWGWQGIYENLDRIAERKAELPVLFLYYYARYDLAMRRKMRQAYWETGVICTGLNVLSGSGISFSQMTCDNGEPCTESEDKSICTCGGNR